MSGAEIIRTILELLPVGFGFHPTDQLLVDHYLSLKIQGMNSELKMEIPGNDSQVDIIPEVDVCEFEPWELPAKLNHPVFSVLRTDDPEWFFFSPLHKKYQNGSQFKRATEAGYWKSTGPDRKIKRRATEEVIGIKKNLVFHRGRGPSAPSTGWIIHEYHAVMSSFLDNKTYVLCRLKRETGSGFPPETNFNSVLPEMQFIQATPLMNMEVEDSWTGTWIHQNGPDNIMTSVADQSHPASNIASDISYYQLDFMTPEGDPLLDEHLSYDIGIDPDGFPYEELIPQRRSSLDSGNLNHGYIGRLSTCPQTPLKGAYGKGGGSSSDTHTQVAQVEVKICNGKDSSNSPDTVSAGHEPSSSPDYLVNLLVGMLLLVILIAVIVLDIRAKVSMP